MTRISRRIVTAATLSAPFVVRTPGALAQTDRRPMLVVAVPELPPTLEPAMELSNVGTRVTYSIFDTLIRRDFLGSPDGGGSALRPHLAESGSAKARAHWSSACAVACASTTTTN